MTRRGGEVYHPRPTKLCARSHLLLRPTAEKPYGKPASALLTLFETADGPILFSPWFPHLRWLGRQRR